MSLPHVAVQQAESKAIYLKHKRRRLTPASSGRLGFRVAPLASAHPAVRAAPLGRP